MYILNGSSLSLVAKRDIDDKRYGNIGGQKALNMVTDQIMLQPLIPRTVATMPAGPLIHRHGHDQVTQKEENNKASNVAYMA